MAPSHIGIVRAWRHCCLRLDVEDFMSCSLEGTVPTRQPQSSTTKGFWLILSSSRSVQMGDPTYLQGRSTNLFFHRFISAFFSVLRKKIHAPTSWRLPPLWTWNYNKTHNHTNTRLSISVCASNQWTPGQLAVDLAANTHEQGSAGNTAWVLITVEV